jgi:UDP-glucose 4-epimerase
VADLNMYRDDVGTSNTVNVDATSHVLQTCNELGIQLFFASTCCVYGNNHLPVQDETSDICPTDAYAAGKRASEVEILDNLAGNNHVIMRLATFYGGPHCRPALAIRKFIQQALKGETITVFGNGTQTRTYTHVHDVASGIIALVTHRDSLKHSIYNLTQSTPIAVMDILKSIHENIGGTLNIDFSETGRKGEDFDQQVIQSNRLREVGWSPQFTWSQGVRESVMIEQNLQE